MWFCFNLLSRHVTVPLMLASNRGKKLFWEFAATSSTSEVKIAKLLVPLSHDHWPMCIPIIPIIPIFDITIMFPKKKSTCDFLFSCICNWLLCYFSGGNPSSSTIIQAGDKRHVCWTRDWEKSTMEINDNETTWDWWRRKNWILTHEKEIKLELCTVVSALHFQVFFF